MTALCQGCDSPLHNGYCLSCSDVMPGYIFTPEPNPEGQVWSVNGSGGYLGSVRSAVGMASFDGEIVSPAVAAELRGLGQRWAA